MDAPTFDELSRIVSLTRSRRAALGALAAAGLGSVLLTTSDTEGKGKGKKKRKCKKVEGKPCTTDKTCCNGKTNNICAVPSNGSNSDKFCCGGTGAKCAKDGEGFDTAPFCCVEFTCNATPGSTGSCQPNPPDV